MASKLRPSDAAASPGSVTSLVLRCQGFGAWLMVKLISIIHLTPCKTRWGCCRCQLKCRPGKQESE